MVAPALKILIILSYIPKPDNIHPIITKALLICPGVNLALNIGVDGGEHYEKGSPDPYAGLTIGKMKSPLMYNDSIKPERKQKILDSRVFFRIRMIGLVKKFMSYGR